MTASGELIHESPDGAYAGPQPEFLDIARSICRNPHFDVFDWAGQRLLLAKCSRLADDENPSQGCYGIDFHRALPSFRGDSEGYCNMGSGPVAVNAYNYARYLPKTLKFREFTANLAFAAETAAAYAAKRRIYRRFYALMRGEDHPLVIAVPHCGQVNRPPDDFHPFPGSEIDAWTPRVAVACARRRPRCEKRLLVSLHSTDYFGTLMDIGDFGLRTNRLLTRIVESLNREFAEQIAALIPAYRTHSLPYTLHRLEWLADFYGTLDPSRLYPRSSAAGFEVKQLLRVLARCTPPSGFSLPELRQGLENFLQQPAPKLITVNGVFSGRKTARLIGLAGFLHSAGIDNAVQVECSRFLAHLYPNLAADLLTSLVQKLSDADAAPCPANRADR